MFTVSPGRPKALFLPYTGSLKDKWDMSVLRAVQSSHMGT